MIKDKPHAIDKWAQEVTHRPKCKVGGPTGRPADQAGRLTYWSVDQAHGPHHLNFDTWHFPVACLGRFARDQLQMTPPLGRGSLL